MTGGTRGRGGTTVDGAEFDRLARGLGQRRPRRVALAAAVAVMTGALVRRPVAAAFDRDCTRFVLAAGNRRTTKFQHVDDDLLVEVQRKGSNRWKKIYVDDDGTANEGGKHADPIKFRAQVGDKIRITAANGAATGGTQRCELDEIWLFCAEGGSGKKLRSAYQSTPVGQGNCRVDGVFVSDVYRIKP